MDNLKSLQVFRAIVEQGSMTKAAKQLCMSVPMVSKHLTNLEQQIQVKLLQRSSRNHSLTEVGRQYYQHCCHALDTLTLAKVEAQSGTVEPKGKLKVAVPVWFAMPFFAQLIAGFSAQYPQIQLSLYLENKHVDLIADGYDVALRVTANPQPNLIVKPLTKIPFACVASPMYLAQHGTPYNEVDLVNHIGVLPNYVAVTTNLLTMHDSNNTMMILEMVKAGMGIATLPTWLVEDAVATGHLVNLFESPREEPILYAAYMNREFLSVKVRLFIDFLTQSFN